jgi:GTP-binding protein
MESEQVQAFIARCDELGYPIMYVSAVTGEGLRELVKATQEKLAELPPITVYEAEYSAEEEAIENSVGVKETTVTVDEEGRYIVEGEWLYNFMGQINFEDYESLNFFQRVLIKNGVIDKLRRAGIEEGDTVSIYDFEFDFVY